MSEDPGRYPEQQPDTGTGGTGGTGLPDQGRGTSPWLYVVLTLLAVAVVGLVVYLFVRPSGDDQASPSASPSTTSASPTETSPSPSPSPSSTVDLTGFSTDPVIENGFPQLGDQIGFGTDLRVGHHDGYDRVTYEFSGSGTPSYKVEYTTDPRSQGSGDPVDVKGDVYLSVTITSVSVPDSTSTAAPTTPSLDGTVFAQVDSIWGGFEGYGEGFIGINGDQRPFKVTVLQNPMRLVIDVANG